MSDLAEFLTARLDEDEQVARDAAVDSGGTWKPGAGVWGDLDEVYPVVYDEGRPAPEQAEHIARWDPARVLAEVAAKRRLIDAVFRYESTIDGEWGCCHTAAELRAGECPQGPIDEIDALRILALPYAGHPDYREEWTP